MSYSQKIRDSPSRSITSTNPYDDEALNKGVDLEASIGHVGTSGRSTRNSSVDLDASFRGGAGGGGCVSSINGSLSCLDEREGDDETFCEADEVDDEDDKENDYEIPLAHQQMRSENGSGFPTPPLPRRGPKFSDSGSRNSCDGFDETPPELPYRPPLPRRNEVYATRSGCSDRSDPDISGTAALQLFCLFVCILVKKRKGVVVGGGQVCFVLLLQRLSFIYYKYKLSAISMN